MRSASIWHPTCARPLYNSKTYKFIQGVKVHFLEEENLTEH